MPEYVDINMIRFLTEGENGSKISHKISRGMLPGSEKTWIVKETSNPFLAKIELLAQEFFRLIIPHQPETRIAENTSTQMLSILSEEVQGYNNLPLYEATNFYNGTYTGLGQAVVVSMFLQEIDLKSSNIGLDSKNRVIKIDGDWCFGLITYDEGNDTGQYKLSENAIKNLPFPVDFYTFNWLNCVTDAMKYTYSDIVDRYISNMPQFRSEVNQAMLKISLIPDHFIEKFVDAYMPSGAQRFIDLITSRRDELKLNAVKNPSFEAYLKTQEAKADAENILTQMKTFQASEVPLINENDHEELKVGFEKMFTPFVELAKQLGLDEDTKINRDEDTKINLDEDTNNIKFRLKDMQKSTLESIKEVDEAEEHEGIIRPGKPR